MYTVAFIMRRKPELSLDEFLTYYRDIHGPLIARLLHGKGLISYEHFPVDTAIKGARYMSEEEAPFDALSIYSFDTRESAEECWAIPELIEDSEAFIDFSTMVTLPTMRRLVYPAA